MKLRNKKTGEHGDYQIISAGNLIRVREYESDESWQYDSIARFNEKWEDYAPVEPFIKDEKTRKVVRAWAEFHDIHKVSVNKGCYYNTDKEYVCFFSTSAGVSIEIAGDLGLKDETYTIGELCGEEEG